MDQAKIEKLLSALDDIINHEDGSYKDKRDELLDYSDDAKILLTEFASWFEADE